MKKGFDFDWLFCLGDFQDAYEPDFDDGCFRKLNIPHDWSIEGEYARTNPTGRRCGFLPAGIGWYRKKFIVPDAWMDKIVSVLFDGIYMNGQIWLNGNYLGNRPYGYIPARYDITPFMKKGENVLAVRVDNANQPSSRWYNGSGIYRHAWLIVKQPVHLRERNIFIYATGVTKTSAEVTVEYGMANGTEKDALCTATVKIMDRGNNVLAFQEMPANIPAHSELLTKGKYVINKPVLWSPEDPYLYRVEICLKHGDAIIDSYTCRTGIRSIEFDPDRGMFLNGNRIKLKGVCLHHDAGPMGAAVPDKVLRTRLQLLKKMGCNAIRTAHNPFAPEFYDFCDELGIMVMDEIFDGWHKKAEYDYGGLYFEEWWRRDVADFVYRDRNHPCIILWSIGNETGREDIHGITELFHRLDPTRKVTGGEVHFGVDIAGFNGRSERPGTLEEFKLENPDKCIVLTEVPHTYQTRGFYRTKKWYRDYNRPVHDVKDAYYEEIFHDDSATYSHAATYNSSYDTDTVRISNRDCWARTMNTDFIIGQFMWTGIDYLGESFGWPYRSGNNAPIDLAGFPKDIFYFYQSVWTAEPMVHILPHWTHSFERGRIVPVWVYTNCESVELFLNGTSLGRKSMKGVMNQEWFVPYIPGELRAVGYKDGIEITDRVVTAEEPYDFIVMTDTANLKNDMVDIAEATVSVVDRKGNFVPYADNHIHFFIQGAARFKGAENGDPVDLEPNTSNRRKAFKGLCKAYVESVKSPHEGATAIIAGIMGRTDFKDTTTVRIVVKQVILQQGGNPVHIEIYYTLDGTEPTAASRRYSDPFAIAGDTVVTALLLCGDCRYLIKQEFYRGMKRGQGKERILPVSSRVVGKWRDGQGRVFEFMATGVLNIYIQDEKKEELYWWYEDPIDEFENEQCDIDNGEINFMWSTAKLRLMQDNSLRVKDFDDTYYLVKIVI